jgi:photosystem II stability/assembly factor-like uncharacterized protein
MGYVVAVGSDGRYRCGIISVTFDGGTSWDDTLIETYLDDIAFLDAEFGVAVTHNGLLLETYDGGVTWKKIESIGDKGNTNVSVYENALYILLLNGVIYRYERALVTTTRHSSVETKYKRMKYRQLITVNRKNGFNQITGMDLSGKK